MSPGKRQTLLALSLLVVLAGSVRMFRYVRAEAIGTDGYFFFLQARALGQGDWTGGLRTGRGYHPLYPAAIAVADSVVGGEERAGFLVPILLGAFSLLPLYALTRSITGSARAALLACFFLAILPRHVQVSADTMSDGPYLFFLLCGMAAGWNAVHEGSPWAFAGTGLAAALAYLTRPEGVGILIVVPVMAVGLAIFGRPRRATDRLGGPVLAAAVFLLVASPYLWAIHEHSGQWRLTMKKEILPSAPPAETARKAPPPPPPAERAVAAVEDVARQSVKAIDAGLPFLPLGLILLLRARRLRGGGFYLLGFLGLYTAVLLWLRYGHGYVGVRHTLNLAVAGLPAVGFGVEWLAAGRRREGAILAGILVVATAIMLPQACKGPRPEGRLEREMGRWIAEVERQLEDRAAAADPEMLYPNPHRDGTLRIVGTREKVAYYAGGEWLPQVSWEAAGLVQQLGEQHADWFIYYDHDAEEFNPNLVDLFSGHPFGPTLALEDGGRRLRAVPIVP